MTYHFRSEEELLTGLTTPAFQDLAHPPDDAERVRREGARRSSALQAYTCYLIRHRRVASWLSREVAALTHPMVLQPTQVLTGRVDALLVAGSDDPLARLWGAAISQAPTGPTLVDVEPTTSRTRSSSTSATS